MQESEKLGEASTIFTFLKGAGVAEVVAPSLLDAKVIFQARYGYWPSDPIA